MNVDLVFEGGGVKGIAFAGALQVLEDAGYEFNDIAGTSAGAIVGALAAVGYNSRQILDMVSELDFQKCKDNPITDYIPIIGPALSMFFEKGLYAGDYLEDWIDEKLAKAPRPAKYFSDLDIIFKVVATDISRGEMIILPDAVSKYNINPLHLTIAKAVRMSMSIPFFFEPMRLSDSYIVDGGVLSNYPIHLFDSKTTPRWPTFGLRLVEPQVNNDINGPISMFAAIFSTMLGARDIYDMENAKFVRTISIPTFGVKSTDFILSAEIKKILILSGSNAANEFLKTWDWDAYKKNYRS